MMNGWLEKKTYSTLVHIHALLSQSEELLYLVSFLFRRHWTYRCCRLCSYTSHWLSRSPERVRNILQHVKKTAGLFVCYLHISGKGDAWHVRELTQSRPRARTWIRKCLQGYRIMTVCSVVLPQIPHLDYSDKGNWRRQKMIENVW